MGLLLNLLPRSSHLSRHATVRVQDLSPPGLRGRPLSPAFCSSPKVCQLRADALVTCHEGDGCLQGGQVGRPTRISQAPKSPSMKTSRKPHCPLLKAPVIECWDVRDPQLQPSLLPSSGNFEAAGCLQNAPQCCVQISGHRLTERRWSVLHPILKPAGDAQSESCPQTLVV